MIHRSGYEENIFEKIDSRPKTLEISGRQPRERISGAKRQKQRSAAPAVARWAAPPVTAEQSQQLGVLSSRKGDEDADQERCRRF